MFIYGTKCGLHTRSSGATGFNCVVSDTSSVCKTEAFDCSTEPGSSIEVVAKNHQYQMPSTFLLHSTSGLNSIIDVNEPTL